MVAAHEREACHARENWYCVETCQEEKLVSIFRGRASLLLNLQSLRKQNLHAFDL